MEGQEKELLKLIRRETQGGELEDAVSAAAKALKSTPPSPYALPSGRKSKEYSTSKVKSMFPPPPTSAGRLSLSTMTVELLDIP